MSSGSGGIDAVGDPKWAGDFQLKYYPKAYPSYTNNMKFEGVFQVTAGLKIANFKGNGRTSVSYWSPEVSGKAKDASNYKLEKLEQPSGYGFTIAVGPPKKPGGSGSGNSGSTDLVQGWAGPDLATSLREQLHAEGITEHEPGLLLRNLTILGKPFYSLW